MQINLARSVHQKPHVQTAQLSALVLMYFTVTAASFNYCVLLCVSETLCLRLGLYLVRGNHCIFTSFVVCKWYTGVSVWYFSVLFSILCEPHVSWITIYSTCNSQICLPIVRFISITHIIF